MLTYNLEGVDEDGVQPEEVKDGPPRAARPFVLRALAVLGLVAVFAGVLLVRNWRADSDETTQTAATAQGMPSSPEIESKYGVRFLGVDITSAGGMIQVRYQVLDSAKTEVIHTAEATPHVIAADGTDFNLPGMPGHSHIGPVKKAGTSDYVLLANARGALKPGAIVTIKMGDLELHDVLVD
jgi:hypothetical protein